MRSVRSETFFFRSGSAVGQVVYFPKRSGPTMPRVKAVRVYTADQMQGSPVDDIGGVGAPVVATTKAAGLVLSFRAAGNVDLLVDIPYLSLVAVGGKGLKRFADLPIDSDLCSVTTTDADSVGQLMAIEFQYVTEQ